MLKIEALSQPHEVGQDGSFLTKSRLVLPLFPYQNKWVTEYTSSNLYSNAQRIVVDWNHRQPPPPVYIDTVPNGHFLVKHDPKRPFRNIQTTDEALVRIDISGETGLIFGGGSSISVDSDGSWSVTGKLTVATVNDGRESLTVVEDTKFKVENGRVITKQLSETASNVPQGSREKEKPRRRTFEAWLAERRDRRDARRAAAAERDTQRAERKAAAGARHEELLTKIHTDREARNDEIIQRWFN